jgi:segregation and condensation protein A
VSVVGDLELDLDVFAGPFDLLLSLILREELDLLEVDLADVVIAYVDHLEAREELDLEATTEFLVLIAALLELKSRLMLPGEEADDLDDLAPGEAADELLARMLAYARHRGAAQWLRERFDGLGVLRGLLARCGSSFAFDEAVRGADRMTVAVTLYALLELYKRGEAAWEQDECFGAIQVRQAGSPLVPAAEVAS